MVEPCVWPQCGQITVPWVPILNIHSFIVGFIHTYTYIYIYIYIYFSTLLDPSLFMVLVFPMVGLVDSPNERATNRMHMESSPNAFFLSFKGNETDKEMCNQPMGNLCQTSGLVGCILCSCLNAKGVMYIDPVWTLEHQGTKRPSGVAWAVIWASHRYRTHQQVVLQKHGLPKKSLFEVPRWWEGTLVEVYGKSRVVGTRLVSHPFCENPACDPVDWFRDMSSNEFAAALHIGLE